MLLTIETQLAEQGEELSEFLIGELILKLLRLTEQNMCEVQFRLTWARLGKGFRPCVS